MKKAWEEIARLEENNATHRAGWKLGDVPPLQLLKNAAGELIELADSPDDVSEMADIIGCLIGYCVKKSWTRDDIERALLLKLKQRFD